MPRDTNAVALARRTETPRDDVPGLPSSWAERLISELAKVETPSNRNRARNRKKLMMMSYEPTVHRVPKPLKRSLMNLLTTTQIVNQKFWMKVV